MSNKKPIIIALLVAAIIICLAFPIWYWLPALAIILVIGLATGAFKR